MSKIKKVLFSIMTILVFVVTFALVGCGKTEAPQTPSNNNNNNNQQQQQSAITIDNALSYEGTYVSSQEVAYESKAAAVADIIELSNNLIPSEYAIVLIKHMLPTDEAELADDTYRNAANYNTTIAPESSKKYVITVAAADLESNIEGYRAKYEAEDSDWTSIGDYLSGAEDSYYITTDDADVLVYFDDNGTNTFTIYVFTFNQGSIMPALMQLGQ